MQPSNSLIALGIGTAIAASSVGAVPAQAAPLASHRHTSSVSPISAVKPSVSAGEALPQSAAEVLPQSVVLAESKAIQQQMEGKPRSVEPENEDKLESLPAVDSTKPGSQLLAQAATEDSSSTEQSSPVEDSGEAAPERSSSPSEGENAPESLPQNSSQSPAEGSTTPETSEQSGSETPSNQESTQSPADGSTTPETPEQSGSETPSNQELPQASPTDSTDSSTPLPETEPPAELTPDRQTPSSETSPSSDRLPEASDEPAPEYLDPDPNPLSFPTRPEEVEIVGTQPITLRQAIELAIRNNRSLQQTRLELERAQASLREQEAQNLPSVIATAGLSYQAQQQGFPNQTRTGFDGTSTTDQTSLTAQVEGSYSIFTGGRRRASIRAAQEQVRFQELQLESEVEQLILDVTGNYYDLQGADEQVRIAQDSLREAEQSLRDAQALERAGVGTRFDVLQAQVDVANRQQELTQQISQQEIARRQIVQQLGLSQSVDITAADPIEVAGLWDLTLEQSIVLAFKNRAELEQQLVQREISEQNRKGALAQLRPQVSVSTSYGVNRTLDSNQTRVEVETPFFEGFLSNFQAQLGVRWQIFDGGAARAQADQAEANIAIAENQFASNRDLIRFRVEQAYSTLRSSYDNIQVTSLAVQQATEALRLARLRFQAGVGTQTDVLQQQTALTRAEVNRLTAILNYNRALATLQREVSNLPDSNLADTP